MHSLRFSCFLILLVFAFASRVEAQIVEEGYELQQVFSDTLYDPVDLQSPRDGTGRLFVVEVDGWIRILNSGTDLPYPPVFLDLRERVARESDGGLFGLAFHPDFEENGYLFVNYTLGDPLRQVVSRFRVDPDDPDRADPESEEVVLEIPLVASGHNGGQLAFGPDGYLYVSTGDGNAGSADSLGYGQDTSNLLGTVARIDVDNPSDGRLYGIPADNPFVGQEGVREEIYAYGFRNPWRFSFDPETGDLWLGDVGESAREEVDLVEAGGNYGWSTMEGTACFDPAEGCDQDGLAMPVWDYAHDPEQNLRGSVTGGHVYRGERLPELVGKYVYGDFVRGTIWALDYDAETGAVENTLLLDSDEHILAFGVDAEQELYVTTLEDRIYRLANIVGASTEETPERTALAVRAYPNPADGAVTVEFELERPASVRVDVYDALGRRVAGLVDGFRSPGRHDVAWQAAVANGTYFVRVALDGTVVATREVAVVR